MAASVKVFWLRTGVKLCENLLRKHQREAEWGRRAQTGDKPSRLLTSCVPLGSHSFPPPHL